MKTIIYVDGYCSGNPGPCGFRGVDQYGKEVFKHHLGHGTNNIAEYVAIATAIKYIKTNGIKQATIYSDSQTALSWIANGETKSSITHDVMKRATEYLNGIDFRDIIIRKWDTRKYGEIPADFGHKSYSHNANF